MNAHLEKELSFENERRELIGQSGFYFFGVFLFFSSQRRIPT